MNFNFVNHQGTGINVPPPTIHSDNNRYPSVKEGEIEDGKYREDPSIYLDPKYNVKQNRIKEASAFKTHALQTGAKDFVPVNNFNYATTVAPVYEQSNAVAPQFYQSRFQSPLTQQPKNYFKPQQNVYENQNYNQQTPVNIFAGHPAQNIDIFSGSYSISY